MSTARDYRPHYTYQDYLQWLGNWELWFGTAIAMTPSPFGPHERVVAKFVAQIDSSVSRGNCQCAVYAGLDWLVYDDTVVRPDVMLVCGPQPERHLEKPPTLVIEVLSESTATKHQVAKRELYEQQKVAHYLIVDVTDRAMQWLMLQSDGKYIDQSHCVTDDGHLSINIHDECEVLLDLHAAIPRQTQ